MSDAELDGRDADPTADPSYCPACGEALDDADAACPACGAQLVEDVPDRTVAAIGALSFGGFGFHWFYLGRVRRGLLYWCLMWTLLPALVAGVEGIYFLLLDDAEFRAKYAT